MDKTLEKGKAYLRSQGLNFSEFKRQILELIDTNRKIDEDSWVEWYNTYAEGCVRLNGMRLYDSVKDFAEWLPENKKKRNKIAKVSRRINRKK